MTDKPTPTTDLLKRCAEIHEWRSTGVLSGEALRDYAKRKWPDRHDTLQMAEHETVTEALALLAKWGTPATGGGSAGTVGYTVHGTQYVNWRTKPPAHGTPLYTTPQPTQAQAASSAVLKAIREANMQLVRTGDDAFMLVPYKAANAQAADSVTAPAPPPECETEAEKRAFAFGWFKALESERMKADNKKKDPL